MRWERRSRGERGELRAKGVCMKKVKYVLLLCSVEGLARTSKRGKKRKRRGRRSSLFHRRQFCSHCRSVSLSRRRRFHPDYRLPTFLYSPYKLPPIFPFLRSFFVSRPPQNGGTGRTMHEWVRQARLEAHVSHLSEVRLVPSVPFLQLPPHLPVALSSSTLHGAN